MLDALASVGAHPASADARARLITTSITAPNLPLAWLHLASHLARIPSGESLDQDGGFAGQGVLYLDWEFIDEAEDYEVLTRALARLAADHLEISDVSATLGEEVGRVEFTANGTPRAIDVEVTNDWVDPALLIGINEVLAQVSEHRFYFLEPPNPEEGGQDTLIVVTTPGCAREFAARSGLVLESPTA